MGGGLSYLFRPCNCCGLVEFPGPIETLPPHQKRKRSRLKNNTRQPSEAYRLKRITFQASSSVRKTNSYLEFILL